MLPVSTLTGLGRSPGGGYGNPFQYSCLENPMDRGAWQSTVHRVTKSQTPWSYLACRCASWGSIKYINQVKGHNVKSLQWKLGLGIWSLSCLTLCDPMYYQAPPSMGFPMQEYWNGLPFPSPADLPNPGIKPESSALLADYCLSYQGSQYNMCECKYFVSFLSPEFIVVFEYRHGAEYRYRVDKLFS